MNEIQVAYKDIVLPDGSANEEYLAGLRNRLKELEGQGQEAMLKPLVDAQDCKDVDAALEVTAASVFRSRLRRRKFPVKNPSNPTGIR